jgi:hypothetical protein
MSQPPEWLDPTHPALESTQAKLAVRELISDKMPAPSPNQGYTKIVRSQTDIPLAQQTCGLISWMLFAEPKKLKSGKPVYGFLKLRGNYADADLCKNRAADIIRVQDSRNKINILPVGSWLPITDDDGVTRESIHVNTDEDPLTPMREAAAKDGEKEQARIMREVRERTEEVKNAKDYNDDPEHIDYFTMKRITWLRLLERQQILQKEVESIGEKLKDTRKLLYNLEQKHPDYVTGWIDHYNVERRKTRIPDYIPSDSEDKEYLRSLKDL